MSRNHGMSVASSLGFRRSASDTEPNTQDYTHGYYQLEYLDLSAAVDDEEPIAINDNPVIVVDEDNSRLMEAEYYSFDDFVPATFAIDYEDVYQDKNNYITLGHEPRYETMSKIAPRKQLQSEKCIRTKSFNNLQENTMAEEWDIGLNCVKSASRRNSTCSGSSTSSHSHSSNSRACRPLTILTSDYDVYTNGGHTQTRQIKRKLPLSNSLSVSMTQQQIQPTYDIHPHSQALVRRSFSTNTFKYSPNSDIDPQPQFSMVGSTHIDSVSHNVLPVSDNLSSKTKPDNQQACTRTEELLNGIVKLAEDDVISELAKTSKSLKQPVTASAGPPKVQYRRKVPLHSSKSSPHLFSNSSQNNNNNSNKNINSKPTSPVTSKRFTFTRKGSFSSQHSADAEKKYDKKNKLSEKSLATVDVKVFLDAVEHFDIDKVSSLMAIDKSCINSVNADGFTALDIAVLTNHVPMIKTLRRFGAEAKVLDDQTDHNLCTVLQNLISGAEQQVVQLKSTSTSSSSKEKENEKKLNQWEFKHRLFRRMKTGYEQAGLPGQPQNVKLYVTSDSSLCVRFDTPEGSNGAVVTRYKVEWSVSHNFRPLVGEVFINDTSSLQYDITGLQCGTAYYVRVTAWNMKGFGRCSYSDPQYAIPSSWRDVENIESRVNSYNLHRLHSIIDNVRSQADVGGPTADKSSANSQLSNDSPPNQRKSSTVMRGLRGIFSSAFKFQKSLKRGVYLACVCYNDDKILVTTEDNIPIVEVDESYSGNSLQADFDWLMKVVASAWDTARQLKQDLEKLSELSSVHLKSQLLSAVLQLQSMMGIQDLGKLFYKPINDGNGSIVLAIVNQISDPKQVGNLTSAVKWQSQAKLTKNSQPLDPLLPLLNEMIFFHQVSHNTVPDGLYLGYLHVKINVESIRVLAPENNPSVLPFIKIRDCPNVSKPEWQSLLDLVVPTSSNPKSDRGSEPSIITFKKQIMKSAKKLADKLGMTAEEMSDHRLYDVEVLDFSKNVSFILLIPPRDLVCTIKPQPTVPKSGSLGVINTSTEYMEIPVKAFEMIHLHTYQEDFISTYSKAACLVDTQLALAQHSQREAFSNEEVESSRKQVESTRSNQQQLEEIWRSTRWLMDAITYARDKTSPGITLNQLYNSILEQSSANNPTDGIGKSSDDGYHSDKISIGGSTNSDKLQVSPSGAGCKGVVSLNNTNNNNGQYYDGELDYHHLPAASSSSCETLEPGILRVYAAYNSGLAKGTSVMLHVTPKTTAREVVNLVVMQLNQAVIRKGLSGPTYTDSKLLDFCLVAVIGPRERVLRDDYRLLQLQNPWTKGKLYVRLKNNLLAALEHGETTEV